MKRVLVTGASGFLGGRLVPRLVQQGFDVTATGHSREVSPFPSDVRYERADLTDAGAAAALLSDWVWDAVVNLAGPVPRTYPSWSDGAALIGEHVRVAANVRMFLPRGFSGRFVHTSSMTVYGMPESKIVSEDHPRRPMHPYALAKSIAEDTLAAGPSIDRWVLRFGGLFAPERRGGALFHFVRAAHEGRTIEVDASSPTPWNILHVDDAVAAIVRGLSAKASEPGPINISYGEPIEITDIAHRIAARTGANVRRNGDAIHPPLLLGIDKARTLIEWPPATLDQRLNELWEAWR